jgi:hypothetical protein
MQHYMEGQNFETGEHSRVKKGGTGYLGHLLHGCYTNLFVGWFSDGTFDELGLMSLMPVFFFSPYSFILS